MSAAPTPNNRLTPDDHGLVVIVFIAILASFSAAAALVRFYISILSKIAFQRDDAFYILALAALMAQIGTLKAAEHYGLGRHIAALSSSDIENYFKFMYASHLLGLAVSTTLSKASLVALFRRILSERMNRYSYWFLTCMVTLYGLFSIFALAFQCKLPAPWRFEPANCPTRGRLFYPVIIANIVTDVVLAFWIVPDIWSLMMRKKERITVIGLFAARALLVCVVGIFQMIAMAKAIRKKDQTWDSLEATILEYAVVNLSFIAATLPRIHSYLNGLQAGLLSTRISEAEVQKYRLKRTAQAAADAKDTTTSTVKSEDSPLKLMPNHGHSRTTHILGPDSSDKAGDTHQPDGWHCSGDGQNDRDSSQASLRRNVVYQTQEFTIAAEYTGQPQPTGYQYTGYPHNGKAVV